MAASSTGLSCCGILFGSRRALREHQAAHDRRLQCTICEDTFTRPEYLDKHSKRCQRKRSASSGNPVKVKKIKIVRPPPSKDFNIRLIHRGMEGLFKIYRAQLKRVWKDFATLTTLLAAHIIYLLERAVLDTDGIKAQLRCTVEFYKDEKDETGKDIEAEWHFLSDQAIHLHTTHTQTEYARAMAELHRRIDEFTRRGSGWILKEIKHLDLYISKYSPIHGRSYCKLPKELENTKAIVNPQNSDNKCFLWSVLAKLHKNEFGAARNPQKVRQYEVLLNRLNLDGLEFPIQLDDIPRFEEKNGLAINVFGYGSSIFPLYTTKDRSQQPINLLLLTPENGPAHYCWIKNLDRSIYFSMDREINFSWIDLFRSTKFKGKKHICNYCMCAFNTSPRLKKHQEFCTENRQRIEIPEDPILKFKNIHRQIRVPYVFYADFECFLTSDGPGKKKHVPNSYCLMGVKQCCGKANHEEPVIYRGLNPVKHFLDTIIEKGEQYQKEPISPMKMTREKQSYFRNSQTCHICDNSLDDKVRDHCHSCGKFRGAAHSVCNSHLYQKKDIPVFFHNLRRYDGHLIMQELGTAAKERGLKMECIAKGAEDYISFKVGLQTEGKRWNLRFVDSMAFLNASLETLTKTLPQEQFHALKKFTKHPDLVLRKGVYPYDFMTDEKKFELMRLPPYEAFYNKLKLQQISLEDYHHAEKVWTTHQYNNMGQYHDLYLKTDVLLLADIFQGFRDFSLTHYCLGPAHYITLPSLAWDALLKKTAVELELLTDPDMYQFFTAGIRGGISTIVRRYAKANNPKNKDYDPQEPLSYIMYWDANNLYGWAMKLFLPVANFEWMPSRDTLPKKEPGVGYVWEVDLEYPEVLHEMHNDYPLAPEKIAVPTLSPYCKRIQEKFGLKHIEQEKLIPNLMKKERYIIHHRNLDQCIALGLKIDKIHRGIKFEEKAWMAPYIDFNTEMRRNTSDAFQKDLFKLLNNAVFGKSMENVFGYVDVRLVTDPAKYEKLVASPLYKQSQPFSEDLTGVLMHYEKAILNRPIYTGFSILEQSKTLMYDFHYNYIQKRFPHANLLFTDTDSLCYHIEGDVHAQILEDRDRWFDTSNYPKDNPLFSETNKKIVGYMTDEKSGQFISEFVGLRSKMYSLKVDDEEHKRAKGIARAVVNQRIEHQDYVNALKNETRLRHEMTSFRTKNHNIYTVQMDKFSLSAYDDKRYILEDGATTLAYGHKKIPESTSV